MNRTHHFHKIIIIESLKNERKTGKELFDDCLTWQMIKNKNFISEYFSVNKATELADLLIKIKKDIEKSGEIPILHFEIHGNTQGFELAEENQPFSWYWLKTHLTEINIAARNGLLLTLASCYGAHLVQIVSVLDRSPFWALIAPENSIYNSTLIKSYQEFYAELLETMNGDNALKKLNNNDEGRRFRYLNTEYLLYKAFKEYIINHCNTFMFRDRLENIKHQLEPNIIEKLGDSKIEEIARQLLLSDEAKRIDFEKFKTSFLMLDLFPENQQKFNVSYDFLDQIK